MPLLGKKIFHLVKPPVTIDPKETVFYIKHTGEIFQSKDEYSKRIRLYNEKVWTCQCTGHINLTHEEAWKSEQDARQLLKKIYPEYLEKPVLEIVHHSTLPLDTLIDQSYVKINSMFFPGDHVQFKVKNNGRVIRGRVVNVDNTKDEENRMSPCSDKENSESTDCNHNESPRKYPPKLLPYKYNIRLLEEDKIISAVPAEDLVRYDRPPNKDTLRLFIRAQALRQGTSATSPWVVDAKLVKKYSLQSKIVGTSNSSLTFKRDSSMSLEVKNGDDKKRRNSADDVNVLRRKKLKLEITPINNQHNYSKMSKNVVNSSNLNDTTLKTENSDDGDDVIFVSEKSNVDVVDVNSTVSKSKSSLSNSVSTSKVCSELDHSYSSPKKKSASSNNNNNNNNNSKVPLVTPKKSTKEMLKEMSPVVKLNQLKTIPKTITPKKAPSSTKSDEANEKTTKIEKLPEVKIIKSAKGNPSDENTKVTKKRVNIDERKSSTPKKKKMKQVTLFDISLMKKTENLKKDQQKQILKKSPVKAQKLPTEVLTSTPSKIANSASAPTNSLEKKNDPTTNVKKNKPKKPLKKLTPSQVTMLVQRISALLTSEQKSKSMTRLFDRLLMSLTSSEIENLPEIVKVSLQRRREFKEKKEKGVGMPKVERVKVMKKNPDERVKEKKKKTPPQEDKNLESTPLPQPHLVATPDGVPNELFGDAVMVVEFINCYSGLLMPNEPYPVQTDLLLKAIGSGKEGFGYLSRILLILLQTLLQDRIAEDYKELGVRLSDLPINIHTTSELVRLCLRKHDDNIDEEKIDDPDEEEDVSEDDLSLLESSELYQLVPEEKLRILVGLCHRILNSYSVQEYMEQKQKNSANLWKDLMEQKKLIATKTVEWEAAEKEINDEVVVESNSTMTDDATNQESNEKDVSVKPEGDEEIEKTEASNKPVLRTMKSRQMALLEKKKLEEKKMLEIEKNVVFHKRETLEKNHNCALVAATIALRQTPLGFDRNHARYWLFSHGTTGLYLEKGWVSEHIDYRPYPKENVECDQEPKVILLDYDSEDEPLANLKKKPEEPEYSIPVMGQNLWFTYNSVDEVEQLISSLNPKGVRERKLLQKLNHRREDITKSFNLMKVSKYVFKPSDGDSELVDAFKKELTETEVRVRKGLLGGVPNLTQWESKLDSARNVQELIPCLLETQANVLPRFLRGIMKMEESADSSDYTNGERLQRWIDAVDNCPTMSRLHVLLGVLDACILWEKSSENAKCKICRRKDEDLVLILCDNCNLAFHLFCLRPALTRVPDGEWICPACQPTSTRLNDRVEKLQSRQNEDETQTAETNKPIIDSSSSNERQLRSGTKTKLRSRPEKVEPQWKEESTSSEEIESSEDEDASELDSQADECCMCGGDEDVVRCSKCNLGYHTFCHVPNMHNKPRGKWICNPCQSGKKPKSIQKARKKWQKWKYVPSDGAVSNGTRSLRNKSKNFDNGDEDDEESVNKITTRLRQRINDATSVNSQVPKISSRQARALRRALERDED